MTQAFNCPRCQAPGQTDDSGSLLVVTDEDFGVACGVYEVTHVPYHVAKIGMVGLLARSLRLVSSDIAGMDTGEYAIGVLCGDCKGKVAA